MNIAMSADCFYPAQLGGPSNAIYWQAKALTRAGHQVTVVATAHGLPISVPINRWLSMDCGRVIYADTPHFYLPVRHIWYGWQAINEADVVHINSLFYPASILWLLMGYIAGKPVAWSPHGELSAAALKFRPYLKRALLTLFRRVSKTVWFHATSADELRTIQSHFGRNSRIGEIANRMELPPLAKRNPQPYLLFIGRIHPIKAIDRLLIALSTSHLFRESDYTLVIAGPDDDKAYRRTLTDLVQTLGLSANVSFMGRVEGQRKEQLYADAHLLVLPSHSENFGNVVIESLAQGTPVLASTGTPWQTLVSERAGSWVSNEPDALRQAIEEFLQLSPDCYASYRKNALALARRDYDIFAGTRLWERFYARMLHDFRTSKSAPVWV